MVCWSRVQRSTWLMVGLAIAFLCGPVLGQAQNYAEPEENPAINKKREAAEATFEMIKGYIEKEDYANAQKETRTLLDLKLPPKYDPQVVEAIIRITDKLAAKRQFSIAHAVVDMANKELGARDDNKAKLLKTKAYIFKAEGKIDQALEFFNRARSLESPPSDHTKDTGSKDSNKQ